MRWRLLLEEYGPEIEYIKGPKNVVTDALSRLPKQGDIVDDVDAVLPFVPVDEYISQCTSRKSKLNKKGIEI